MKHAGSATLDALEPLLAEIRSRPSLTERKRGVFYRRSSAFLHFHEDPAGVFADVRGPSGWLRLPANTSVERRELLRRIGALAVGK
jgi:hypothetical protein